MLFAAEGYHAVGIDRILAVSGVAKATLYAHFRSKEALIVAVLERESQRQKAELDLRMKADDPKRAILSLFRTLEPWFTQESFRGCLFQRAAAEYPDSAHTVHRAAARHKRMVFEALTRLCARITRRNPVSLAQQLMVLLEGAIAVSFVSDAPIAARRAGRAAERLLDAASVA